MNNYLLITIKLKVCIIFALPQLFSKGNPGLMLELFFEMPESVLWRNVEVVQQQTWLLMFIKVQNPGYGWLRYSGHGWQKNEKEKKNTGNCKASCVSRKRNKLSLVLQDEKK